MIKKSYDAIIIGAGNIRLCLGAYLQRRYGNGYLRTTARGRERDIYV